MKDVADEDEGHGLSRVWAGIGDKFEGCYKVGENIYLLPREVTRHVANMFA